MSECVLSVSSSSAHPGANSAQSRCKYWLYPHKHRDVPTLVSGLVVSSQTQGCAHTGQRWLVLTTLETKTITTSIVYSLLLEFAECLQHIVEHCFLIWEMLIHLSRHISYKERATLYWCVARIHHFNNSGPITVYMESLSL